MSGDILLYLYYSIASRLANTKGDVPLAAIIGGALILVAYLMFPHEFHSFIHKLYNMFFSAVSENFQENPEQVDKNPPAQKKQ